MLKVGIKLYGVEEVKSLSTQFHNMNLISI